MVKVERMQWRVEGSEERDVKQGRREVRKCVCASMYACAGMYVCVCACE